jgi:hypothetical protein
MNFNPLPPIKLAYETAQDSFRIARRALKTQHPSRQRLLQRTVLDTQTLSEAERLINQNIQEAKGLYVLTLWATFERFLRDYLQHKGAILQQLAPPDLAQVMYRHFEEEVEFWRPDEILDFLRESLLKPYPHLAGEAKIIYNYRNWIAHGKNPRKNVQSVFPESAYTTLESIVNILLANP